MLTWLRKRGVAAMDGRLQRVLGDPRPPDPEVRCGGCRRRPFQIAEYVELAEAELGSDPSPSADEIDSLVKLDEGTFNPETNRFLCTEDYIRAGMPTNSDGTPWRCP
jgi:hypothetical protein